MEDEDAIQETEELFDQTWWMKKINSAMVLMAKKGPCVIGRHGWNWVPQRKAMWRPNNSKRKTLRTHRDGKSYR